MTIIDDLRKDNLKMKLTPKIKTSSKIKMNPNMKMNPKLKRNPKIKMASIKKTNKNVKVIHAYYEWAPELLNIMEDVIEDLKH